jgi:hypothetical protein
MYSLLPAFLGSALSFPLACPTPGSADLARGTKVAAVAAGNYQMLPVESLGFRNSVYVLVEAGQYTEWRLRRVRYNYSTPPGTANPAVRVTFGSDASQGELTVTEDHLFAVINGAGDGFVLKRANTLIPGSDMLMSADENAVPIRSITFTTHRGGMLQIATGTRLDDDWQGHLIITNGVVSGDYLLQLNDWGTDHDSLLPLNK